MHHRELRPQTEISTWRRASACNPSGNCVEINRSGPDRVAVRDSKQPAIRPLRFTIKTWAAFLTYVA
ncbi:MAG TPA: DUF397 domain-containing protein [Pseudonocardiaceae bacterium]|nr:DUF397 domain-containing protein [Pseudonocardiaceae bacterium]